MKSFYSFFEQAEDTASQEPKRMSDSLVTTFGRHNPPHIGHKLVLDQAHDVAQNEGADQRFYTSHSQDRKKNPLPRDVKLKFLKKMFPDHAPKWDGDDNVRTVLGAAEKAHKQGYKNFHFMGGGDRREGMENLLRKYNGNLYNFKDIYAHSAGDRDELGLSDDPIAKMSASRQRRAVQNDDYDGFMEGMLLNKSFTKEDAKELFDAVKMYGMKNEEYTHEELRDIYTDGNLYHVGDIVESLSNGLSGEIRRCGANHLIVVTEDGIMFKSFIHDVHSI
tara:strand:+ start:2820 stop:3650 length:831 start_codon:yes stop_codon:yes gene_type:complete